MHHVRDINKRHLNGQDSRYLFLAKKTEKIVSAIFMVSDLLGGDVKRIKRTLQEEGISLLEMVHQLHAPIKFEHTVLVNLEQKYTYMISLLEVALQIHLISESNASLLIKELYGCIERVHSIKTEPLSELQQKTFDVSSFEVPAVFDSFEVQPREIKKDTVSGEFKPQTSDKKTADLLKGHFKDTSVMSFNKKTQSSNKKDISPSREISGNNTKHKRKDDIVSFLRGKKNVPIGDIYNQFNGITSKTIQRDLNDLIKDNRVVREGNKRWSTYTLVS